MDTSSNTETCIQPGLYQPGGSWDTLHAEWLSDALAYYKWNISKTSEALVMSRVVMHRYIKKYGLTRPERFKRGK